MAELSGEERDTRRDAVGDLGAALRDLVDAAVRTEVPIPELAEAAALARELAGRLRGQSRELHEIASVDDPEIGERWYSPVYGPGNPVAPPMVSGKSTAVMSTTALLLPCTTTTATTATLTRA